MQLHNYYELQAEMAYRTEYLRRGAGPRPSRGERRRRRAHDRRSDEADGVRA